VPGIVTYNPLILAYDDNLGPFTIPLQQAKSEFGRLPSEYELLSPDKKGPLDAQERNLRKALNLELGVCIRKLFEEHSRLNLKGFVHDFSGNWHRDYAAEFGLSTAFLFNLNDWEQVERVIDANRGTLSHLDQLDVRDFLREKDVIRKDVLNSVPNEILLGKSIEILSKMLANDDHHVKRDALSQLRAKHELEKLALIYGPRSSLFSPTTIRAYADEIAGALGHISQYVRLERVDELRFTRGQGLEFDYAPRDKTYLRLGRNFGDCTSDQMRLQSDVEIENIYWTVFSWILDGNYQILRVLRDGHPVVKCHILPLYIQPAEPGLDPEFFLAVDAIETVLAERAEDEPDISAEPGRVGHREVFESILQQVLLIADKVGIRKVYSERFSNTKWVRTQLSQLPEIFLDTRQIMKLDGLEDVYACAAALARAYGYRVPPAIFMELQAKNTYLLPDFVIGPNKSYALIRGGAVDGISLKKVYGI